MELSFYKIRLFRNDFIVIPVHGTGSIGDETASRISRTIAKRRVGVGATGVLFLETSEGQEHTAVLYDAEGRHVRMVADAFACASRYLIDSGMTDTSEAVFREDDAIRRVSVIDSRRLQLSAGIPRQPGSGMVFDDSPNSDFGGSIILENRSVPVTPVSFGTDYYVFIPVPQGWKIRELDERIRQTAPGVTASYLRIMSPDEIRVYCRPRTEPSDGVEIVSSAAVAAVANGYAEGMVATRFAHDFAVVSWNTDTHMVYATVRPSYVYTGEFYFDNESP